MAEIQFTRRALRDIRKLPPETRREIEIALDQLLEDPRAGDPLHGEWKGYWKLRARDYRIIYRISAETVEVQYVRLRREASRTA
ncbi:MAG: type II toxin-antitoxin system RelE family toxin [bacterium]